MNEEHQNDIESKCLKRIINQIMRRLITYPLTERQLLLLCVYQFMILLTTYLFILKMNIVEHCLQIFINIMNGTTMTLFVKTIKIMMMLHLVEETRILIKALLCNCNTR
jgi:hypothetical protein